MLTNASIDIVLGGRQFTDNTAYRATADWGLMFNTSRRAGVGASLFASIEKGFALAAGPAVRYRRWTGSRSSLDLAIGSILILSNHELGSVFGLIKYSFNDWVGIALRPEFVRSSEPTFFGSARRPDAARITVGLELGWWPGALLTVLGGSLAGAAASIKIGP